MRNGLWGGFSLGVGSLSCSECDGRETGFSGNARIGGTLSQNVRLAAGTNSFFKSEDGVKTHGGALTGQVLWFPGGNDFFLLGGLGYAWFEVSADFGDFDVSASDGVVGIVIGAGYDIEFFQLGVGLTFN